MNKLNPRKPIPYQLSMWNTMTEIFYKCAVCGQNFKFYFNDEHYCHNCGNEIDWTNVPHYCTEEFKNRYNKLVYDEHMPYNSEQVIKLMYEIYNQYKNS